MFLRGEMEREQVRCGGLCGAVQMGSAIDQNAIAPTDQNAIAPTDHNASASVHMLAHQRFCVTKNRDHEGDSDDMYDETDEEYEDANEDRSASDHDPDDDDDGEME
jgi:hypothetical protein